MNESLFVVAVACVVLFVGLMVPVLIQLRRTLRSAEVFLETTGVTLRQTLEEVSSAAVALHHATVRIEENMNGVERTLQEIVSVADSFGKLRRWVQGISRLIGKRDDLVERGRTLASDRATPGEGGGHGNGR